MTEFIRKRPEMFSGKLTKTYTKQTMRKLWSELPDLLNCVSGGPAKDWNQWRKVIEYLLVLVIIITMNILRLPTYTCNIIFRVGLI